IAGRADAQALAVDQHQRALWAEVAQVDVLAARFLVGGQWRGAAEGPAAGGGNVLQDVGNRAEALVFNFRAGNGQDRLCGLDIDLADARTGDLDAIQVGGAGLGFVLGVGGTCGAGTCDQRKYNCITQLVGLAIHGLSLSKGSWCFKWNGHRKEPKKSGPKLRGWLDSTSVSDEIKALLIKSLGLVELGKVCCRCNKKRPCRGAFFEWLRGWASEVLFVTDVGDGAVVVTLVTWGERIFSPRDDVLGAEGQLSAPGSAPGDAEAEAFPLALARGIDDTADDVGAEGAVAATHGQGLAVPLVHDG